MSAGPRRSGGRDRARPTGTARRGRVRLTRIRAVLVLTAALGLAQIFFEDAVLFLATTRGGLPGVLSSPLVAIGIPLAIAALLVVVLVGGALWADDAPEGAATIGPDPDGRREDPEASDGDPVGSTGRDGDPVGRTPRGEAPDDPVDEQ